MRGWRPFYRPPPLPNYLTHTTGYSRGSCRVHTRPDIAGPLTQSTQRARFMPSKPWLENACPTQNYNARTAELQLVQGLAAILTAVAANQSSSRRDRDWPWGSRLAHDEETVRALKLSTHSIRFPPAPSPQAGTPPAATGAITASPQNAGAVETGYSDAARANRASAEDESLQATGTLDALPKRRIRRYRAWPDSMRAIVACT